MACKSRTKSESRDKQYISNSSYRVHITGGQEMHLGKGDRGTSGQGFSNALGDAGSDECADNKRAKGVIPNEHG